jgi:hypothetical protein
MITNVIPPNLPYNDLQYIQIHRIMTSGISKFHCIIPKFKDKNNIFKNYRYKGRIFTLLTGPMALCFMAASAPLAARRIWIFPMNQHAWWLTSFGVKGTPYLCSHITEGVENAVSLHVDIPHTGRRDSDLPFEAGLQEYLQFPYEYFLLVLPFGGYCCNLCPSNNPRRTNHQD